MHSQAYMTTLAGRWSGTKVMSTHICPRALFLRACFLKDYQAECFLTKRQTAKHWPTAIYMLDESLDLVASWHEMSPAWLCVLTLTIYDGHVIERWYI